MHHIGILFWVAQTEAVVPVAHDGMRDVVGGLQWYHVLGSILLLFSVIFILFRYQKLSYKDFNKQSEIETNVKETRHYFLILGVFLPILEIFIEYFRIRLQSELWMTVTLGILAELTYFVSGRSKFLQKNILIVFSLFFCMMLGLYFYKTLFAPFELITFAQLLITIFFSYAVFRTSAQYYTFMAGTIILFGSLLLTDFLPFITNVIYLYSVIVIFILNYVWRLGVSNSRERLLFANNIVHKGNSLILGTNRFGHVSFCSENIIKILGYKPEEVMGNGFWELTEDPEFMGTDYSEKYVEDKLYTRKLKCANGNYRYIQWIDKKYNDDLFVGIGQDVTEQVLFQEKYKNIVENATDIIYEADSEGNFIFFNDVAMHMLGYHYDELFGKHFSFIIREDYKMPVAMFYSNPDPDKHYFDVMEFPIIGKDGTEHWVSQKVTIKRNEKGHIVNFTAIVRDITAIKKTEFENAARLLKARKFNEVITHLTTSKVGDDESLEGIIDNILVETARALKVDRISIWYTDKGKIICSNRYTLEDDSFGNGDELHEAEHPEYFHAISRGETVIANNVCEYETTASFCTTHDNDLKSLLDVPIFSNGLMVGLVCCEMVYSYTEWDTEEINFARSIAEIISVTTETQKRRAAENAIKQSELNFRLINESIKDDFWLYDNLNQRYVYHSPNSIGIYGVDPEFFYQGKHHEMIKIHPEDQKKYNQIKEVFKDEDSYELEYRIIMADGSVKWIQEKSSAVRNEQGRLRLSAGVSSDITLRKVAENKLIESENTFRLLNETIDDVFWLYDLVEKKIIYISHSCVNVLGVSQQDFYETSNYWTNYIFEEDKPDIIKAHEDIEKCGYFEVDYRIRTEQGVKWIHEKSFGIKDEHGRYVKSSGISSDITQKKETEIQLKQLSIVAEKTTNGILIANETGHTLWANQGYLKLMGITLEELVGNRPRDLFNPNDKQLSSEIDNLYGKNFTKEIEVLTNHKQKKWIEINNTSILDEKNNIVQQIEIVTDITEKVENRKKLLQYSEDLEYQSVLQKKIINAVTHDELADKTLRFIKEQTQGCIRILLLNVDGKSTNLSGYLLAKDQLTKIQMVAEELIGIEEIRNGKTFIQKDLRAENHQLSHSYEKLEEGVISFVKLPIMSNGTLIGLLGISLDRVFDMTENQIRNLESFSVLVSVAMQQISLRQELFDKNKDTIDSLNYAQNIQNTILPEIKLMTNTFRDVCLYFRPRDIVSGDFYWAKEFGGLSFLAVADCTGHGVPGSFLTLIGNKLLEQIVTMEKLTDPSQILARLDEQLYFSLNSKENDIIRDGMEISFCVIDSKQKKLSHAGAGLGLLCFRNEEEIYLKGQRKSIGDYRYNDFAFVTNEMTYNEEDTFYMATDGFQDQLGGSAYKRFSKKRTIELLKSISGMKPEDREAYLDEQMTTFIGHYPQTDDITVLGFKLI